MVRAFQTDPNSHHVSFIIFLKKLIVWLENGGKASKSLALGMVPRMHLVNLGTLHLAQTCHGKVAISCIFFGIDCCRRPSCTGCDCIGSSPGLSRFGLWIHWGTAWRPGDALIFLQRKKGENHLQMVSANSNLSAQVSSGRPWIDIAQGSSRWNYE